MEKQIQTTFWSKLVYVLFKAELRRPEGPQERSPIPIEVGNSCVYLQNQMVYGHTGQWHGSRAHDVSDDDDDDDDDDVTSQPCRLGKHKGSSATCMSIDSCQIKKPADQCHMTISRAQMYISEDVY